MRAMPHDARLYLYVLLLLHRRLMPGVRATLTGETGTYLYMAPEVMRCVSRDLLCSQMGCVGQLLKLVPRWPDAWSARTVAWLQAAYSCAHLIAYGHSLQNDHHTCCTPFRTHAATAIALAHAARRLTDGMHT